MLSGDIWLVGCGNMGSAMLRGWLAQGVAASRITVIDPGAPLVPAGVTVIPVPPNDKPAPSILMLAVKPQILSSVARNLAAFAQKNTLLISILAGSEIPTLRSVFPDVEHVLRVMPNLPAAIGRGVSILYADTAIDRANITPFFEPLGGVEWIEREDQFHAITALTGCGPAFVFRYAQAMAQAATSLGLNADQATRLALATIEGAAAFAASQDETLGQLADRVASPGGVTREGLNVIDGDDRLFTVMRDTLSAACAKNREMAKIAP
jgi:pyrroline-5-carboxylate reductase